MDTTLITTITASSGAVLIAIIAVLQCRNYRIKAKFNAARKKLTEEAELCTLLQP
jgi:hypothetical protein